MTGGELFLISSSRFTLKVSAALYIFIVLALFYTLLFTRIRIIYKHMQAPPRSVYGAMDESFFGISATPIQGSQLLVGLHFAVNYTSGPKLEPICDLLASVCSIKADTTDLLTCCSSCSCYLTATTHLAEDFVESFILASACLRIGDGCTVQL